jgi:hypothetical protein
MLLLLKSCFVVIIVSNVTILRFKGFLIIARNRTLQDQLILISKRQRVKLSGAEGKYIMEDTTKILERGMELIHN